MKQPRKNIILAKVSVYNGGITQKNGQMHPLIVEHVPLPLRIEELCASRKAIEGAYQF